MVLLMSTPNPFLEKISDQLTESFRDEVETLKRASDCGLAPRGLLKEMLCVSDGTIKPAADDADAYTAICSLRVLLKRGLQNGHWYATAYQADQALLKGADDLLKLVEKRLENQNIY